MMYTLHKSGRSAGGMICTSLFLQFYYSPTCCKACQQLKDASGDLSFLRPFVRSSYYWWPNSLNGILISYLMVRISDVAKVKIDNPCKGGCGIKNIPVYIGNLNYGIVGGIDGLKVLVQFYIILISTN